MVFSDHYRLTVFFFQSRSIRISMTAQNPQYFFQMNSAMKKFQLERKQNECENQSNVL